MTKLFKKIRKKGILTSILYILYAPIYSFVKKIYISVINKKESDKKYIIFTSKPDFSDNAKYLYEYMLKERKYKYVWLISKNNSKKYKDTKETKFVKLDSKYHSGSNIKALHYMSKAKIIFFTHQSPAKELKLKNNQLVINLWHGCGYKASESNEKNKFDYALVPGKVFVKTKSTFWKCDKKQILTIGYPRYDLLFKEDKNTAEFKNTISKKNKLIIWMPTFRKTGLEIFPEEKNVSEYDMPLISSDKEMKELDLFCKKNNIVLCIKRHPYQLKYRSEALNLKNILFIDNKYLENKNIELYSLLKYTDGLITDYSSIAIDYLLLNKPIGFTLDDFEEYSKARGFVFKNPKDYMPGHHIYNFDDMKEYIKSIGNNKDQYKENRESIMNEVHNPCNNYCERIINKIEKLKEGN